MGYSENRQKLIDQQLDQRGHIYCERCETSQSFKFHCHHLVFRSEKPKHHAIHIVENLMIVCDKCHEIFHADKSVRNDIVEQRRLNEVFGNDILNK